MSIRARSRQPDFLKKDLHDMSDEEWESLCDGCGLCCQIRLQDEDTDEIVLTNLACDFLCLKTNRCSDYQNRLKNQPLCAKITPHNIKTLDWLPETCGYRRAAAGKPLPYWHHLVCGDKNRVHREGPSMIGELIHEKDGDLG